MCLKDNFAPGFMDTAASFLTLAGTLIPEAMRARSDRSKSWKL